MADASIVYKNVGDGLEDITEASESIISTMKAFNIEASDAMSIADKYNEIGNKFAISSSGVGVAMQKSASALAYANNSLDESIALVVAANATVQDPDVVGTALKTLSMRLRAMKVELEEAGESTEGMAETTSELRSKLMALSGVDIMDGDSIKSTYQIMTELAAVWDKMSDTESAAALELIAGKRMANTAASIISNIEDAGRAFETSQRSAGSAMAENEKYLESIQGHWDKFDATYESLSQNIIDSDAIKTFISGLTNILELADSSVESFGALPAIITTATIAMKAFSKEGSILKQALTLVEVGEVAVDKTNLAAGTKRGLRMGSFWDGLLGGANGVHLSSETIDKANSVFGELNDKGVGGFKRVYSDFAVYRSATLRYVEKELPEAMGYVRKQLDACNGDVDKVSFSVEGLNSNLGRASSESRLIRIGTNLLSIGLTALASILISKVIEAFDKYVRRVEIAKEEAQNFYNDFEAGKEKLEGFKAQLDEISDHIDELNRKGKLSLVEENELRLLQAESAELQNQIRIQERLNDANERLAKERAKWAYENDRVIITGSNEGESASGEASPSNYQFGTMVGSTGATFGTAPAARAGSRAEYLVTIGEKEKELQAKMQAVQDAYAAIETPTAKETQDYNDKIKELNDQLNDNQESASDTLQDLQSTLEIVGADSDIGKEIIRAMGSYFNKIDSNYTIDTFVDAVARSSEKEREKIEEVLKKISSGELSGEWAAEALKAAAPKIIASLELMGVTAEDLAAQLAGIDYTSFVGQLDQAAVEAAIYTNKELAASLESITEKVDELGKAYWEQAENGSISISTLQTLMANHENWVDLITVENGLIKLNGNVAIETGKKYIQAEIDKVKASMATLEAIKASTEALKEQALTLGSMSASAILAQEAMSDKSGDYDRMAKQLEVLESYLNSTAAGFTNMAEATDAAKKAQEEYEKALKAEGEAAISALDKKIEAKQKELDLLEKEYEEEDKLFELQKAKDRYEAAKKNLNTRLYTEDKGWVWVADPTELKDSREALEELEREQAREEAKQAIQDEIDALEELKDKWQDSIDNIGATVEEHEAKMAKMAEFEKASFEEMAKAAEDYAARVEASMGRANSAAASGGSGGASGGKDSGGSGGSSGSSSANKSPTGKQFRSDSWTYSNGTVVRDVMGNQLTFGELKSLKSSGYYDNWQEKQASGYYKKNPVKGYALGTHAVPYADTYLVDELGPELIAKRNEAGRLTHLEMGDTVFPADMTQRLWDLAATGAFAMASASRIPVRTNLHESAFIKQQAAPSSNDTVFTGCTFELNNVTDVDSFFSELGRIANRHRRK